jgi:hypothetical protein
MLEKNKGYKSGYQKSLEVLHEILKWNDLVRFK